MLKRLLTLSLSAAILVGCGGAEPPPLKERPKGTVSVVGYDAELIKAKVSIFKTDDKLQKTGDPVFVGSTDDFGRALSDELNLEDQYLLAEVGEEGYYFEEATGIKIDLVPGDVLTSIQFYKAGDELDFTASGFTHIATSYAQCLVSQYGENASNALGYAVSAFTALTSVDLFTTEPVNPSLLKATGLTLDKPLTYGILHSAVSKFMAMEAEAQSIEPHSSNYRSIDFYKFAARDIAQDENCALDGVVQDSDGENITLGIGTYVFSEDTYRVKLGRAGLEFVRSDENKSAVTDLDFLPIANIISMAENSRLFNGVAPKPLDDDGPNIVLPYTDGQYFGSVIDYSFLLEDYSGVHEVELFLDGLSLGKRLNETEPVFNGINTGSYDDGEHAFKIVAIDNQYVQSELTHNVVFWNASPIVEMTSEQRTKELLYDLELTLTSPIPVTAATVNGGSVNIENSTITTAISVSPGINVIPVTATNSLGGLTETNVEVYVDRTVPSAILLDPKASYNVHYSPDGNVNNSYLSPLDLSGGATDPLYMSDNTVALNGQAATNDNLINGKFAYIQISVSDDSGSQPLEVITPRSEVEVTYSYYVNNAPVFEGHELTPNGEGSAASVYRLPFTEEYLVNDWFLTTPTDVHEVRVHLVDIPGNQKNYSYIFQVRYFPGNPLFDFAEIETRYNNYSLLTMPEADSKENVFTYTFKNENDFPVKIALNDFGTTGILHKSKSGYKEHLAKKLTYNEHVATCSNNGFPYVDIFGNSFFNTDYTAGTQVVLNIASDSLYGSFPYDDTYYSSFFNGLRSPSTAIVDSLSENRAEEDLALTSDFLPAISVTTIDRSSLVEASHGALAVVVNDSGIVREYKKFISADFARIADKGNSYFDGYHTGFELENSDGLVCPLASQYVNNLEIHYPGRYKTSMSLDANSIIENQYVEYVSLDGYPKTTTTDSEINHTSSVSYGFEAGDYSENEYVIVEPGSVVNLTGKSLFTSDIALKGDDCIWDYNGGKACDQEVVLNTQTTGTLSVTPYVEGKDLPVAEYIIDSGEVVSVIH